MDKKPIMTQLGEYVRGVLDTNGDGAVTIKDFLGLFPNHAVAIAVLFLDIVVAVAEYRVWDFGLQITGDPLKAAGFVILSAVPFYLGQLFWLYPRANTIQIVISISMIAASIYTSWMFGTADLTRDYNEAAIFQMVTNMTVGYIIVVLVYIISDNGIKAHRTKVQAKAAARQEAEYQQITREVLQELNETLKMQRDTEKEFDADSVAVQMERLRGRNSGLSKLVGKTPNAPQSARQASFAQQTHDALGEAEIKPVNPPTGQGQQ